MMATVKKIAFYPAFLHQRQAFEKYLLLMFVWCQNFQNFSKLCVHINSVTHSVSKFYYSK